MNIKVEGRKKGGRQAERNHKRKEDGKEEGGKKKKERRNVRCHWRASHENLFTYKGNKTKETTTTKIKATAVEELIHLFFYFFLNFKIFNSYMRLGGFMFKN